MVNAVDVVLSTNVLVSANTVDVARSSSSSSDKCYSINRSNFVTFDSNSCHNTGGLVFSITGSIVQPPNPPDTHDLTLTNNQLYTTEASSPIATHFFDFNSVTASNVTIRGNR